MVERAIYEPNPVRAAMSEGKAGMNESEIADKIGGLNLFGDEDLPKEEEKEVEQTVDDDSVTDDVSTAPDVDAKDDQPDEDEPKEDGETDESQAPVADEDQAQIESIEQLAEALGVDSNALDDLPMTLKVNGENKAVTLSELRDGYQRRQGIHAQVEQLNAQKRENEQVLTEKANKFEQDTVVLGQMLQQAKNLLLGELNSAEMQTLRTSDPGAWAARHQELQQRATGIDQLYYSAAAQYQQFVDNRDAEQQKSLAELRQKELTNLRTALPDWNDAKRDEIVGYLHDSFGFSNEDLANVMDSRLIIIADKARKFDQMEKVGKKTKKAIKQLPKVVKAKRQAPKTSVAEMNLAKAKKRLAQSKGGRQSLTAAADVLNHFDL